MHVAPSKDAVCKELRDGASKENALQLYDPSPVRAFAIDITSVAAAKLQVCLEHSIPSSFTSEWNSHLR